MSDQTRAQIIEAMARAAAVRNDYDGCFERIDEWESLEQWERDAHPEEAPGSDYEDAAWWRDRAAAALDAALPLITAALAEKVRDDVTEGDSDEHVDALMRAARLIEEGL